ncbi:acyltransferase family protein [Streptomyces sp. NPDC093225]|uniref:acyltransferase family protein n=1 Tax=Streptomyces sp. NPDC093225 TaxID=3366034 RepID=UPI003821C8C1
MTSTASTPSTAVQAPISTSRDRFPALGALPTRLDSLTSLRFFAAFAVFTHHFTGLGHKTGYGRAPLLFPYSQIGVHGVTFFFVLSGFLLTWVHKPEQSAGAFYWRRMARIWPATLVAALPAYYVFYVLAHEHRDWGSIVSSIFLVQNWFPDAYPTLPGNPVTWTLCVEMLFYALFPFAARALVRLSTRRLVVLTAAGLLGMVAVNHYAFAYLSDRTASWVMRHPIVYMPEFLLGITLALAVKRGWRLPLHPAVPVLALGAYVFAYYQARHRLPEYWDKQLECTVRPSIAILAALIMLAFVQREIAGRRGLMNSPVLINLGIWSYCFYLIHHSVSRWATYEYGRLADDNSTLFGLLGLGLVATGLAWALHRYVEEPANKWLLRHMPARLRTPVRR